MCIYIYNYTVYIYVPTNQSQCSLNSSKSLATDVLRQHRRASHLATFRQGETDRETTGQVRYTVYMHVFMYVYMVPSSVSPPPPWVGSPGSTPLPFYLQAIGSISEVQLRIC